MALAVSALKQQIEKAKENLKTVDDSIKKVTGRDPNDIRFLPADRGRGRGRGGAVRLGRRSLDDRNAHAEEQMEPPAKRAGGVPRRGGFMSRGIGGDRRVIISSLHPSHRQQQQDSDNDEDEPELRPTVQSSIVSTAKSHTKTELIKAQNVDEKGKARNRRMFGMLLGTLAKFQSDESKADLATKQEQRRTEIEKRLEESTAAERKKAAAERRELFNERRSQQKRIMLLEQKVVLAGELEEWEAEWEKKSKFIMTKASPPIFFLPKDTTGRTIRALQESKKRIKDKIAASRSSMQTTIDNIDAEIEALDMMKKQASENTTPGNNSTVKKDKPAVMEEAADDLTQEPNVDIDVESGEEDRMDEETEQKETENDETMQSDNDETKEDAQPPKTVEQNGNFVSEEVMEEDNDVPIDNKHISESPNAKTISSLKQKHIENNENDMEEANVVDSNESKAVKEEPNSKPISPVKEEQAGLSPMKKDEPDEASNVNVDNDAEMEGVDEQQSNGADSKQNANGEIENTADAAEDASHESDSESGSSGSGSDGESSNDDNQEEAEEKETESAQVEAKQDETAKVEKPPNIAEKQASVETHKVKELPERNTSKQAKSSERAPRAGRDRIRSRKASSSSSSSSSSPERKPTSHRRSSRSSPRRDSRHKPRGTSGRRRRSPSSSSSSSRSRSPTHSSKRSRRDSDRRRHRRSRSRDRRSRRSPPRSSRRR